MESSSKVTTSVCMLSFVILASLVKVTAFSFHTDSKLVFSILTPCEDTREGHCPTLYSICFRFRNSQKIGVASLLFSVHDNERTDRGQRTFRVGFNEEGGIWLQSSVTSKREPLPDLKIKNGSVWHRFCLVTPASTTHAVHAILGNVNQTVNISRKDSPLNFQFVQDRRITIQFGGDKGITEEETYFKGCVKDVEFEVRSTRMIRYHLSLNSTAVKSSQYVESVCVTNEICSLSDTLTAQLSAIDMNCDCPEIMEISTGNIGCPEVLSRGYEANLWVVIVATVVIISALVVTLLCCARSVRRSRRFEQDGKHSDELPNGDVTHKEKQTNDGQRNSVTSGSIAELEWDPQVENKVKNPELEWDPDAHNPKISDLCTTHLDMEITFIDENTVISLDRDSPLEDGT